MKWFKQLGVVMLLVTIAGCGKVGPLEPKIGQSPPDKVYGQTQIPDSSALMTSSEQARPGRSDELMRRSERRSDDPFDLPPGSVPDDTSKTPTKSEAKPADSSTQPE
jgi:predicted small lipoprotein YifL